MSATALIRLVAASVEQAEADGLEVETVLVSIHLRVVQVLIGTAATLNVYSASGVGPGPIAQVPLVDRARSRPDAGCSYGRRLQVSG